MAKAQGISINAIIIAALALLVLVILTVLLIGYFRGYGPKLKSCTVELGGTCRDISAGCLTGEQPVQGDCGESDSSSPTKQCCTAFSDT
jgi:hypothetical protein